MDNVTNSTADGLSLVASWTLTPIVAVLTFIFGCLTNSLLLSLFVKDSNLHTPFNVYLVNLMIANLSCLIVQYPLEILSNLYGRWYMSDAACTVYIYGVYILQAAIKNAHQLIALNRIWAVVHPISYRKYHSAKVAWAVCLTKWIYVHIALLPSLVDDALFYRLPKRIGCFENADAQPITNKVTVLLVYDLPLVVMVATFPVILCAKLIRNSASRKRFVAPGAPSEIRTHGASAFQPVRDRIMLSKATAVTTKDQGSLQNNSIGGRDAPIVRSKHNNHGYLVLALLTVSCWICWAPINGYYAMMIYAKVVLSTSYFQVATVLFSCQCVLDPLLIVVSISSVKNSLIYTLRMCVK